MVKEHVKPFSHTIVTRHGSVNHFLENEPVTNFVRSLSNDKKDIIMYSHDYVLKFMNS